MLTAYVEAANKLITVLAARGMPSGCVQGAPGARRCVSGAGHAHVFP
jgi:hypothetical protein